MDLPTHIKNFGAFFWELIILFVVTLLTLTEKFFRIVVPRSLKSLEGEIILLTGSGNGIGKQIALQLAGLGATIVCWDVEAEANSVTIAELKKRGTKVFGYTVDISERENIVRAAQQVREDVGDVSIVINNAGIAPNGIFLEQKEELFEKVFLVNTISHMWILRQFLPKMIERNHGHVVTTASLSSFIPCKEIASYASSKHAVTGFIDSLRQEILEHPLKPDIKFTTVYPIFVNTRLMDGIILKQRFGLQDQVSPEYIAKEVVKGFRQNYEYLILPPKYVFFTMLLAIIPHRVAQQLQIGIFQSSVERTSPVVNGNFGTKAKKSKSK